MGIQALFDLVKDSRTPEQKRRDRIHGWILIAVLILAALAGSAIFCVGLYQVWHWVFG